MDIFVFLIVITISLLVVFGIDISRKRRQYLNEQSVLMSKHILVTHVAATSGLPAQHAKTVLNTWPWDEDLTLPSFELPAQDKRV